MKNVDNRRMCANCRAFIDARDKVCPYCEAPVGPRAVDRRPDPSGGAFSYGRFTTTVILLINFGLYVATTILTMNFSETGRAVMDVDGRILAYFGAMYRDAILAGQWWRLLTAGFLHGGLLHIGMNSWVLFGLGPEVEMFYGTSRFLVIFFVSTVLGFFASLYWGTPLSVGASAAIFGLIGAMIAYGMKTQTAMGAAIRSHYTQWVIYGVVISFMPGFRIDIAAHLGGLAGGFGVAWLLGSPRLVDNAREKFVRVLAGMCLGLSAVCFALMFLNLLKLRMAAGG